MDNNVYQNKKDTNLFIYLFIYLFNDAIITNWITREFRINWL